MKSTYPEIEKLKKEVENLKKEIKNLNQRLTRIEERVLRKSKPPQLSAKDVVEQILISEIDMTKYEFIYKLKGLPLYLSIIQMALKEFNIDGLNSAEISQILREKFRIRAGEDAIAHALALALPKRYVDRKKNPRGKGYIYRILRKGEDYLTQEINKVQSK